MQSDFGKNGNFLLHLKALLKELKKNLMISKAGLNDVSKNIEVLLTSLFDLDFKFI